jgi:hypothetical protein
MNPALPVTPVNVLRVPQKHGEQKRRDAATADDFRRALQQQKGDPGAETAQERHSLAQTALPTANTGAQAARPMPRGLQPARLFSRREPEPELRHVDVIA